MEIAPANSQMISEPCRFTPIIENVEKVQFPSFEEFDQCASVGRLLCGCGAVVISVSYGASWQPISSLLLRVINCSPLLAANDFPDGVLEESLIADKIPPDTPPKSLFPSTAAQATMLVVDSPRGGILNAVNQTVPPLSILPQSEWNCEKTSVRRLISFAALVESFSAMLALIALPQFGERCCAFIGHAFLLLGLFAIVLRLDPPTDSYFPSFFLATEVLTVKGLSDAEVPFQWNIVIGVLFLSASVGFICAAASTIVGCFSSKNRSLAFALLAAADGAGPLLACLMDTVNRFCPSLDLRRQTFYLLIFVAIPLAICGVFSAPRLPRIPTGPVSSRRLAKNKPLEFFCRDLEAERYLQRQKTLQRRPNAAAIILAGEGEQKKRDTDERNASITVEDLVQTQVKVCRSQETMRQSCFGLLKQPFLFERIASAQYSVETATDVLEKTKSSVRARWLRTKVYINDALQPAARPQEIYRYLCIRFRPDPKQNLAKEKISRAASPSPISIEQIVAAARKDEPVNDASIIENKLEKFGQESVMPRYALEQWVTPSSLEQLSSSENAAKSSFFSHAFFDRKLFLFLFFLLVVSLQEQFYTASIRDVAGDAVSSVAGLVLPLSISFDILYAIFVRQAGKQATLFCCIATAAIWTSCYALTLSRSSTLQLIGTVFYAAGVACNENLPFTYIESTIPWEWETPMQSVTTACQGCGVAVVNLFLCSVRNLRSVMFFLVLITLSTISTTMLFASCSTLAFFETISQPYIL